MRLRLGIPSAELVRPLLGVRLDRPGDAPVRIALAQHWVDGGAEHLGVLGMDRLLLLRRGRRRVLGHIKTLGSELLDCGMELRDGGRHVGQLDDVCGRCLGELAELGELVLDALLRLKAVGELRQDAACHRDVDGLNSETSRLRKALYDGQQRKGSERRRLVRVRPHYLIGFARTANGESRDW